VPFALAALALACAKEPAQKALPRNVVLYNWEDYTVRPALAAFEKRTGFHVVLKEFGTTDEALAQLQTNPGAFDVIIADCENTQLFRDTKLAAPLDTSAIPNAALVDPGLRSRAPYALPFQRAVTGLAVDAAAVPDAEIRWEILLDPRFGGRIALLDDMREVTDVMRIVAGIARDGRHDFAALDEVGRRLAANRPAFGDTLENLEALVAGRVALAMTYNGDFLLAGGNRPGLRFVLPADGFRVEEDCLFVSADGLNPIAANRLVDFLLRPEIGARWSNSFGYESTVRGAERFYDQRIAGNPLVQTPADVLRRAIVAEDLGASTPRYEQLFHRLRRGW